MQIVILNCLESVLTETVTWNDVRCFLRLASPLRISHQLLYSPVVERVILPQKPSVQHAHSNKTWFPNPQHKYPSVVHKLPHSTIPAENIVHHPRHNFQRGKFFQDRLYEDSHTSPSPDPRLLLPLPSTLVLDSGTQI